jgi:hypothetical protein
VPNPKGQFVIGKSSSSTQELEHVQSVVILSLGRQVDNKVSMPVEDDPLRSEKEGSQSNLVKVPEPTPFHPIFDNLPTRNFVLRAHFPERLIAPPRKVYNLEIF